MFRDGAELGALSNLCAHQNGPIGEGRIVDGCVTCPWHGYQYRLVDGCAPPLSGFGNTSFDGGASTVTGGSDGGSCVSAGEDVAIPDVTSPVANKISAATGRPRRKACYHTPLP